MSYDVKCAELAKGFILDYRKEIETGAINADGFIELLTAELAQRIQDVIEDFLEENGLQ